MRRWLGLALAAPGLAGCVAHGATKPIDVLSAFSARNGQRIQVRGFLRYGDDARGFWQSQASYRDYRPEAAPACITLWNAGTFREQLLRRDGAIVMITGKLHLEPPLQADEIALGRCNDVRLIIERVR